LNKIGADGLSVDVGGESDLGLPDADDEPFLAVALAASVDFLVTGNLSDYPPAKRRGCAVVSPAAFMEHWRKLQNEA
jgi:predicted nucleic acid-binding protein